MSAEVLAVPRHHPSSPRKITEVLFNISESDETIIRSPRKKENFTCLTLPTMRQNEIQHLSVNLEAREAKIAQIENSINRIRESMSMKSSSSSSRSSSDTISSNNKQREMQQPQEQLSSSTSGLTVGSTDSTIGVMDLQDSYSLSESQNGDGSRSREVLRQKVREKESALQQSIQSNSFVMDEIRMRREQVNTLVSAMEEKEAEAEKLRDEVARLGNEMEVCQDKSRLELTRQRLAALGQLDTMERKVEAKEEQVNYYEFKLQAKDHELSTLREELEEATRRVVQLEVDLETHDIRFASHEEYIRQVDAEALDMTTTTATDVDGGPVRHGSTVRQEKYMKKLILELSDMERRYMQEKTSAVLQIGALEKDNKAYRTRLISLARHLAAQNVGADGSRPASPAASPGPSPLPSPTGSQPNGDISPFSKFQPNLEYMRKRLELLEHENICYVERVKTLKSELKAAKSELHEKKERRDKELAWLKLENQSLTVKMAELEQDLKDFGRYPEQAREYNLLERKLDQSVVEILSLVEQVYAKERIISSLRSKLVEQRLDGTVLQASSNKSLNLNPNKQHAVWTLDDGSRGTTTDDTTESSSSQFLELQAQLEECQRKLAERDEELRRMQKKSDAKTLTLLTRLQQSPQSTPPVADLYFV
jgi:chromosome segregation ATPase